jgi:hypothetical protein
MRQQRMEPQPAIRRSRARCACRRNARPPASSTGKACVVLPIPRGIVSVLLEHLGKASDALRHQQVVAGIAGAKLHDNAGVRRVMVAPGDQRGTGRRAQRRCVKLGVMQPALRKTIRRRGRDRPAKRGGCAIPDIIGENEQDIWHAGAWTSWGKSGDDSSTVRPILPLNGGGVAAARPQRMRK